MLSLAVPLFYSGVPQLPASVVELANWVYPSLESMLVSLLAQPRRTLQPPASAGTAASPFGSASTFGPRFLSTERSTTLAFASVIEIIATK